MTTTPWLLLALIPMVGFTTEGLRLLAAAAAVGRLVAGRQPGRRFSGRPGLDARDSHGRCTPTAVLDRTPPWG